MLTINQYVKASSLEEAYELNQKKSNVILGGMLWLKMQKRNVGTAIDLSGLGLDAIEETEEAYRIGAMVTLRQMELHGGLNALTQGAARESVHRIVGVQFRNMATVGGSVFGRYGFSDVLTFLMAAGAQVHISPGERQGLPPSQPGPEHQRQARPRRARIRPGKDGGQIGGGHGAAMLLRMRRRIQRRHGRPVETARPHGAA